MTLQPHTVTTSVQPKIRGWGAMQLVLADNVTTLYIPCCDVLF